MPKDIIHFAHANGFPAKTYNKLFDLLRDDFEIDYLEQHAHNPKFPVTNGWEFLAEELREEIEKRHTQKIIGLGHSLGGILHFLVAVEHPELYKALILLDAPVISRLSGTGLKLLKRLKLIDRFSPARTTRFRRTRWPNKDEAFEHFRAKEKFLAFDEEVLRDYIEHGTSSDESSLKLLFNPKIEAEIYRTIPDSFGKFRGQLKVPAAYIGGRFSSEARLARLGFMRREFNFNFYFVDGSHLFPFEKPQETAHLIKCAIANLGL